MNRRAALALAAALAAPAFAAAAPAAPAREPPGPSGKILRTEASDDAASGGGTLTVVDKAGKTTEYSVNGATRVMRDGKKIPFDTALIGDLVVRAKYDPKTKTLSVLELKSSGTPKPAAAPAPASVSGEVAFADAIAGRISVRLGPGLTREFAVGEGTKVVREVSGKTPLEAGFETVAVGDSVEVRSRDGKNADSIRVRAPAR